MAVQTTIYTDTIVYMALYLKKLYTNAGIVSVTQDEINQYTALVIRELDRQVTMSGGAFSYRITNGSPNYEKQYEQADQTIRNLARSANYNYNAISTVYSSDSSANALQLKAFYNKLSSLNSVFTPNGYEAALRIKRNSSGLRKAKNAFRKNMDANLKEESGEKDSEPAEPSEM